MIEPEPALAALLADFDRRGGVVDYVLLPAMPHPVAAIEFMRELQRSWSLALAFDPDKAVGTSVPEARFYGRFYERSTRKLSFCTVSFGEDEGYAYAFGSPPYGLQASEHEAGELFNAINDALFGRGAELEIMKWSTDWSTYFAPGQTWWGAYLWTIKSSERPYAIAIGASQTD
jgi:hypothetical protein